MRSLTCVSVVVCVARKLRPCPSHSRRGDRINLVRWRSLYKGGGGITLRVTWIGRHQLHRALKFVVHAVWTVGLAGWAKIVLVGGAGTLCLSFRVGPRLAGPCCTSATRLSSR